MADQPSDASFPGVLIGPLHLLSPAVAKLVCDAVEIAHDKSFLAPVTYLQTLPYYPSLYDESVKVCRGASAMLSDRPGGEKRMLCVVLLYSTLGAPASFVVPVRSEGPIEFVDVIVFDVRTVFECFAVCMTSPLARGEPVPGEAVAVLKLSFATRLNAEGNPLLNRMALGLTSSAASSTRRHVLRRWVPSLAALTQESSLPLENKEAIVRLISRFILYHESAHIILAALPDLRREEEAGLEEALVDFRAQIDHLRTHEDEANRSFGGTGRIVSADSLAGTLGALLASSGQFLSEEDREEMLCDRMAVASTLAREADALAHPGYYALARASLLLSLRVVQQVNRSAIFSLAAETAKFYDEHGPCEESKRRAGELASFLARVHDRSTLIGFARHFICEKNVDGFLVHALERAGVGRESLSALMADATHLTHRMQRFDAERFRELHEDVLSFEGLFELSSRGKGVELFMSRSNPPQVLRRDADPFGLYIFGRVP
jgi:hypothetical protein